MKMRGYLLFRWLLSRVLISETAMRALRSLETRIAEQQGRGWWRYNVSEELAQIRCLLPQAKTIIDGGGNVGLWSQEARRSFPAARIDIFEPSSTNVAILRERFADDPKVRIIPKALSDRKGRATFFTPEKGSECASLYDRGTAEGMPFHPLETVDTLSLGEWAAKQGMRSLDLLKLDIEGHEYPVLRSLKPDFLRRIKLIQFEFGRCNIDSRTFFRDFYTLLSDHGFCLFRLSPHGPVRIKQYRWDDEYFVFGNFLALRRSILEKRTRLGLRIRLGMISHRVSQCQRGDFFKKKRPR